MVVHGNRTGSGGEIMRDWNLASPVVTMKIEDMRNGNFIGF